MKTGELPRNGLCSCYEYFKYDEFLHLFQPSYIEYAKLERSKMSNIIWGSGLSCVEDIKYVFCKFTPLRQTIVLLMAAMNNEF